MKYHKRVITYDEKTGNFRVDVPDLKVYGQGDTEMSALLDAREEVRDAARRPQPPPSAPTKAQVPIIPIIPPPLWSLEPQTYEAIARDVCTTWDDTREATSYCGHCGKKWFSRGRRGTSSSIICDCGFCFSVAIP